MKRLKKLSKNLLKQQKFGGKAILNKLIAASPVLKYLIPPKKLRSQSSENKRKTFVKNIFYSSVKGEKVKF